MVETFVQICFCDAGNLIDVIDKSMKIIRFAPKFTPSVAVRIMLACGIPRQDAQCKIACLLETLGQLRCPQIVFWRGTTLVLGVLPLL